jgi:hypothetical protein
MVTSMRSFKLGALTIALFLIADVGQAQAPQPTYAPMRPFSNCIHTNRINEWHIVDRQTVIVRTGPSRFLLKLTAVCPRLGSDNRGLSFKSSPANNAIAFGRICGEPGEDVRSRDQPPCGIQSVSSIQKAQFDQLKAQSTKHGSGADQRKNQR